MDKLRIGVDVGGTNTDCAIICGSKLVASTKITTSEDITSGVSDAIKTALSELPVRDKNKEVCLVSIGTTHFVNAVTQRKDLYPVAVVRLCGPSSISLPPFIDFPDELRRLVHGATYMVQGGYQFDGRITTEVSAAEIIETAQKIEDAGLKHAVVSGIFSPINAEQEKNVEILLKKHYPELSITLSHKVGYMGLLERENAAILNESLKPLSSHTIEGFRQALLGIGLKCPFYLTQNDGTLISGNDVLEYPVRTFASGPTNSMRGAAFLSGILDCIVIDIGGTTSDIGVLKNGFPREASSRVKVGGVNTNFRMPDVLSIGLGGGSIVNPVTPGKSRDSIFFQSPVTIGPNSVGYRLTEEALVFNGSQTTATDIAVAAGLANLGDKSKAELIPEDLVNAAVKEMKRMLETGIDRVKTTSADLPVLLVGGGSILINKKENLLGASEVIKPPHHMVANAVGAALSKVSGFYDSIISYDKFPREEALKAAKDRAMKAAIAAGAVQSSLEVVEVDETPLAYIPGNTTCLRVKVVGDLFELRHVALSLSTDSNLSPTDKMDGLIDDFDEVDEKTLQKETEVLERSFRGLLHSVKSEEEFLEHEYDSNGAWILNERDIECIATGAGILGVGGGGSPYLARLRALKALRDGKQIKVIHPEKLGSCPEYEGVVVVCAFMGAPTVLVEKLVAGSETVGAINRIKDILERDFSEDDIPLSENGTRQVTKEHLEKFPRKKSVKIAALMSAEVGGLNAVEPLVTGADLGIPIVDCDGMGRAFPKLDMFLPFMKGLSPGIAALHDEAGNCASVIGLKSPTELELLFRNHVVSMGCIAGFSVTPLSKKQVLETTVQYSISRAWRFGDAVHRAREAKISPSSVLLKCCNGKRLIYGKISDLQRKTEGGFNFGRMKIEGFGRYQNCLLLIDFQNENLIARALGADENEDEAVVLASTPDLIAVLDVNTGEPFVTEDLRYGLRVVVITMSAPPEMKCEEALKFVGPSQFGYKDVEYKPAMEYLQYRPIPPAP